jgi:hypothetical protein
MESCNTVISNRLEWKYFTGSLQNLRSLCLAEYTALWMYFLYHVCRPLAQQWHPHKKREACFCFLIILTTTNLKSVKTFKASLTGTITDKVYMKLRTDLVLIVCF